MITGLALTPCALASANCSSSREGSSWNSVSARELRHDVVIVGIEPLGHLAGRDAAGAARLLLRRRGRAPARHAEVVVQRIAFEAAHPLGQVAEREAHVEHLVVEGEVADRHQIQTRLVLPVARAQLGAERLERVERGFALPVRLQCELQFPLGADARKAEVVCDGHVECPDG